MAQEAFTIPPGNTDVQFYFGGSPATNLPPDRGEVDSGHNKSRFLFPFSGILEPPNLFSPPHLAPLQYPLLCTYFWGRYGTTPKHPSRTRARLATLRSLNWPDNYDELSSPEQKAVRAVQDQKMTEYCLANISAANEEDAATVALINAGPAGTTTNSTKTPSRRRSLAPRHR